MSHVKSSTIPSTGSHVRRRHRAFTTCSPPATARDYRRVGSGLDHFPNLALPCRRLHQSQVFRVECRSLLGHARCRALWRDGGRHDFRHRQQGSRPVGRLALRADCGGLRGVLRPVLFQHGPLSGRCLGARCRPPGRAHQRRSRNDPARSGVHRDADHAFHRARHCNRHVRRQDHFIHVQGRGASRVLYHRPEQRLGLQQPGLRLRRLCRGWNGCARQDHRGLSDLCNRGQRARFGLCRHRDPPGAHARLSDIRLLRDGRRHDAGRSGSRPDRPVGPGPGIDRDRGGRRRGRVDTRRPWPRPWQRARCHPHRAHRQGPARRLRNDAHSAGRQNRNEGAGGGATAAGSRAGLSGAHSDPRRADRAVGDPAQRHREIVGQDQRSADTAGP